MSQTQTINTPQDYVNYTFNIEARGVAEVSSELMGLSNTVGNILGQIAFKTSEFLSHTDMLAIGTGAAISAMFVSATQDAIHFQQQVANVQAIGGETLNAQAIGDAAMEYSNKFGMATSSMTEGLEALARAGITSTNVMKEVLAEGVKLSKLEGLDLEDSINDLISTTNLLAESGVDMNDPGYGQLVQQMNQHIVSTSESAPINAQNIIQSLQHVGGYASASGMDQEDLFAVIAQLGSRGTKGEMAGTALRAFIAAGQKDTAQRALARIGLNVSDLWNDNGETMLSISEMKDVLDNALEARGYSKQEKLEFYSDFAGYKQANQIMKIDTTEVQQYKESIANAWDLGKKLDVILGTVRGNLDRIWQTTQNFMTKVGSNLLGVMSAILTPVRVLLDVITKIPFADKAVAAGMIFVAFRTGLMIFNKLVPAIGGFMSGISGAKDETRSFRGEWRKTREEIEKTKEIIGLIKNRDHAGLAKKHYEEHGLSAKNKADAEDKIAGQMYMGSDWYKQHGRIPWENIDVAAKDMILERFKGTQEFKDNYNAYVERTRANVEEIVSNPIIIEDFEGTDTLEAINVWVQEIFNLLNSDRTQGKFGDGSGGSSGPQSNQERNAQARILSNIFKNKVDGHTYGNYEFNYRDGEEGYNRLKDDINKLYDDIIKKTKDFKNTNVNNITNAQLNTYKKLFTGVSEAGRNNSLRANESEVRLVFEQGKTEHHEQPWQGLKDEQIRIISQELGMQYNNYSSQNGDRRSEIANEIHIKFEELYGSKTVEEQQAKIDEIIQKTNDEWIRQMPVGPAVDPKKILIDNPEIANQIVAQLNIDTSGANNNTQAVHNFFRDEANRTDENLRVAAKSAFEVLKANEMYSLPEQRELQYMLESLERMKNTMSVFEKNAINWGFSSELRDEMQQIIQDMNEHQNLFRGDAENLAAALVEGFVSEGLGRHSPGYMAQATEAEMMDIHRVFQSWITLIRRDTDVIQDILTDFDREDFPEVNETDSQDYQLLQKQYQEQTMSLTDGQKDSLAEFVGWYGFDMSNYQRFGLNYGKSLDDPAQFKTMLHYLNSDFDFEKWIGLFEEEDDYYDYLDTITEVMSNDWEYPQWLVFKDASFDNIGYSANGVNRAIERLYTAVFLDNMAKDMKDITLNSPGTFEDMMFYRGGVLPSNSEGLGEYLGATSTSFTKRIASDFTSGHRRRHHNRGDYLFKYPTRIYAPEGVLGIYPNTDFLGSSKYENIYNNQQEYTLGSGQPFIELPSEKTGELSNNAMNSVADILLLTPEQSAQIQSAVLDEINDMGDAIASSTILSQRGIELGRSFTDAFIEDGLGRHSPGYMVEAVKAEMQDMHDVISEDNTESIIKEKMSGIHNAVQDEMGDSLWGHGMHDTERGMIYDAATYIKKTQNKRVVDQDTFFKLIESVNGAEAAENAKNFLNINTNRDKFIKDNGKIKITPLIKAMAQGNSNLWKTHKDLKKFGLDQIVTPRQVFDLIQKHPEIADELTNVLYPYVDKRMGEKPTKEFFENKGYMDDFFVPLPYEYSWLLGANTANDLVDHLGGTNPFRYGHKPTVSLDNALEIWGKLGPEAILNPEFAYHFNDDLMPTVDNSFERMMLGLVYGTLDNVSRPYGSRTPGGGIHLFGRNTEFSGPEQTLNTLIHEFTHMALQQDYRHALDESDDLYLPTFTDNDAVKVGYGKDYPWLADDFETNWVASQVFKNVGIDQISTVKDRVKGFYEITDKNGHVDNLQWELYDEWIKVITENIDKFIDMAEAFDVKYSLLSSEEISNKWDEIRQIANAGVNTEVYMPGSSLSTDYMNYMNEQIKAQQEAAKRQQDATAGYKDWYEEQKAEQERLHGLRTEYERTEMGRLHIIQEQLRLEEEGKKNAEENRRKQQERWEQQKRVFEEERKRKTALMVVDQPEEPKSKWDELRDKVRERLGGGYYYFGGERKEREQSKYQKWAQKWAFKGIDFAERADNKINEKSQELYDSIKQTDAFGNLADKISTTTQPLQDFTNVLESLSDILPILTPAVLLLNQALGFAGIAIDALTALQAYNTVVTAANTTSKELNTLAEEGNTFATFLNTMAKWRDAEAGTVKNAIGSIVGKGTDILADAIGMIGGMSVGTLAAIAAPIIAIIAAIEALKFWESKHAEALKASQKELEESTAKNNIALSQYKDLKSARENETNAMKKQQAARKEAIALYELESARIQNRKAIHKEANLRNDAVWGEYGLRASLQKMGLGFIAGGDFKSQYENYDGTTKNIREIKEGTLGNLFATPEQQRVASIYDSNQMFFAEVEAYKEPLQELYDKESQLIEQYGSIDLARGSKDFEDAVQEFADATGINGKTAAKMLDWLETENKVNQATQVAKASIGIVRARADAKAMGIDMEESGLNGDMNDIGRAMVYAQVDKMINDEKHEMWWTMLWEYLQAIISALLPWKWGEINNHLAKAGAYQEGIAELESNRQKYYDEALNYYENADRRDYGSNGGSYGDTPFGGAIESAGAQYADSKQQKMFALTGQTMSEEQYSATQQQYQSNKFGITNEQLEANRRKDNQRAYQKAQAEKNKKANSTLGQLQFNGDRAHYDALAIIHAIEKSDRFNGNQDSNTSGGVMGAIIGLSKAGLNAGAGVANSGLKTLLSAGRGAEYSIRGLLSDGSNISGLLEGGEGSSSIFAKLKNIFNIKNLKGSPIFSKISEILYGKQVPGLTSNGVYATEGGVIPTAKAIFQTLKNGYSEGGIKGLFGAGQDVFSAIKNNAGKSSIFSKFSDILYGKQVPGLTSNGVYATEGGVIPTVRDLFRKGKSSLPNIKDILFGKQVEGLAVRPGDYMMEGGLLSKGKMGINQIKTLLRDGGLKASVASKFSDILYGKQVPGLTTPGTYATEGGIIPTARVGLSRLKGAFSNGVEGSSIISNLRGVASSSNIRGFGSSVFGDMKGMFSPKTISGGLSDVATGLKGGGTLLKGASKLAGPAAAVIGGALTFAEEYAEHDPSKTHYNEDGTEKKAFQSTGEVVGSTAGSVAGGLGGAIAGAELGATAGATIGSIVPGVGTAIGGAVGTVAGGIIGGIVGEEAMRQAGDAIGGTLGWVGDQLYNALPDEAKNAWNSVVDIAGKAWDGITDIAGKAWEGISGIFGGIWNAISGAAGGAWDFITGANDTSNAPVKGILGYTPIGLGINAAAGISDWLFGNENDPYQNIEQTVDGQRMPQKLSNAQNTVVIKNININTEDDPEKIKSALMNLIIEMQEQINPRQVSRTVGEPPQQSTDMSTDTNNQNQVEGTDPNNPNATTNNNNQNNGNNNPTI